MRWLLLLLPWFAWAGPYEDAETAHAAADLARAVPLYEQALRTGARVSPAEVKARLGLALRKIGTDLAAAERWLDAAIAEGDPLVAARARRYLARLYVDRNELDRGQALLETLRATGTPRDRLAVLLELAAVQVLRAQHAQAIETYSDAVESARALDDEHLEAVALLGLTQAILPTRDFGMVTWLARQAADIQARRKQWALAAQARVYEAVGLLGAEAYADARRVAEDALPWVRHNLLDHRCARLVIAYACFRQDDVPCAEAAIAPLLAGGRPEPLLGPVWLTRAELALARKDHAAARDALGAARPLVTGTAAEVALDALAGMAADAGGESAEAIEHLRRMDRGLDAQRAGLAPTALTEAMSAVTLRHYQTYVRLLLDAGREAEALDVIARLKSRALAEALTASKSRQPPASAIEARQRLASGARWLAADLAAPPALPGAAALRETLPADLAVVDYFLLPDALVVTWMTRERVRVRRVPADPREIEAAARALSHAIANAAPDHAAAAARVAAFVLQPIESELTAATQRTLAIAPQGPLHQVPFAALPLRDGLVADRWQTFQAPSMAALAGVLARPGRGPLAAVFAVGDARGDLAGARGEIADLARRFPGTRALLGSSATEAAVVEAMRPSDVVHFAVHGFAARRGTPAWLDLLPDAHGDGRLSADEVAGLPLSARLVVLSACESARGEANAGDELVGVLDRAFLRAGAETVVSARWRISDAATRAFMQAFYDALAAGASRVGALNAAQRALRERREPWGAGEAIAARAGANAKACEARRGVVECGAPAHDIAPDHPYYWAAFTLTGDHRP